MMMMGRESTNGGSTAVSRKRTFWHNALNLEIYSWDYVCSASGILHSLEVVLGICIFVLCLCDYYHGVSLFLISVASYQWLSGLYMFITILFTPSEAIIRSSLLWLLHHGLGAVFYLAGGVTCFVVARTNLALTAGGFAVPLILFHLVHFLQGFRAFLLNSEDLVINRRNNEEEAPPLLQPARREGTLPPHKPADDKENTNCQ